MLTTQAVVSSFWNITLLYNYLIKYGVFSAGQHVVHVTDVLTYIPPDTTNTIISFESANFRAVDGYKWSSNIMITTDEQTRDSFEYFDKFVSRFGHQDLSARHFVIYFKLNQYDQFIDFFNSKNLKWLFNVIIIYEELNGYHVYVSDYQNRKNIPTLVTIWHFNESMISKNVSLKRTVRDIKNIYVGVRKNSGNYFKIYLFIGMYLCFKVGILEDPVEEKFISYYTTKYNLSLYTLDIQILKTATRVVDFIELIDSHDLDMIAG